jgi:predicted dienelactone hydrolase
VSRRRPLARRRPVAILLLVAISLGVAACSTNSSTGSSTKKGAEPSDRQTSTTSSASAFSTTTTTAGLPVFEAVHPPYRVGYQTTTFVDHSRATPANGTAPALPYRTLQTFILYPATGSPTAKPVANAPESHNGGPFPLIVFAHGLDSNGLIYFPLIAEWAEAGFVVVAPTFPLSNLLAPGGDTAKDLVNQPGDMSFVLTQVLRLSAMKGNFLSGMIDPRRIAGVGHSLGAMTVLAWAENTCCEDHRIDAAVIIDGTESTFGNGKFFEGRTVPILVMHGTADQTIPYANGVKIYNDATTPKYMISLIGAPHVSFLQLSSTPLATPKWQNVDVESVTDFLEGELDHDSADLGALQNVADVPGIASLRSDP